MNPYLMKQMISKQADGIYLISESAKAQYLEYMQEDAPMDKIHVLGMGSSGNPIRTMKEPPMFGQGVLRVVSCANISEIKQIHLMIEALEKWEGMPICWTHMGGGEGEAALRKLAEERGRSCLHHGSNAPWNPHHCTGCGRDSRDGYGGHRLLI